jgi:hypothetical protein
LLRWLQNYPHFLELAYRFSTWTFQRLEPFIQWLGYQRVDRLMRWPEDVFKSVVFDCRMCGQCILHNTGMTCPMTCPKFIRNGPCGGVRPNGHCEVFPDMRCVWVDAYQRSLKMPDFGDEMHAVQAPLNHRLESSSAWVNTITGEDKDYPLGWIHVSQIPILDDDHD